MKKIKSLLSVLLSTIVLAALLSSCLGDADSGSSNIYYLTASDKSKIINSMEGYYSGKMHFYKSSSVRDSLAADCLVRTDSTATLYFPTEILANYIPANAAAAKTALTENATCLPITFNIYIPVATTTNSWDEYWSKEFYECNFIPKQEDIEFEKGTHKFVLSLVTNTSVYYSGSYYYPIIAYYKNQLQTYALLKSLTYDGQKTTLNIPTLFFGTK